MSDLSEAENKKGAKLYLKHLATGLTEKQATSNAAAEMRGQKPRHQPPKKLTTSNGTPIVAGCIGVTCKGAESAKD